MNTLFYISGAVAVISALVVITRRSAMHALVNLIVTLLAIACVFWTLGAPFAAALQIVVYAGAIMVLFVFAVMILNLPTGPRRSLLPWIVPVLLAGVMLVEFIVVLVATDGAATDVGARFEISPQHPGVVGPAAVGESLFTVYALGVEIASVLLLAGLVAAFHYGVRLEARDE